MKLSPNLLLLALAGTSLAAWGSSKSAYTKWNTNDLKVWLADHDITYPANAGKTDLEALVKKNWQDKVYQPYKEWDAAQLQQYLKEKGIEVESTYEDNKNWLVDTVSKNWHDVEDSAESNYENVKNWIFDTWTESQLKAFLDYHNIPNPTPRTRDSLLSTARSNYQKVADKLTEAAHYPGDWLYSSWSESDLKRWLDERGYKVPQPTTRDKLIASVRRNSRLASLRLETFQNSIKDTAFETWSDSDLKKFLDKQGVKVPQGSKKNELIALARRQQQNLVKETSKASKSVVSAYGAATSKAGNEFAQATDTAKLYGSDAFDSTVASWSDSRLKYFLDSRGIPVPQASNRDALIAAVRKNKNKAQNKYGLWTFENWSVESLNEWLKAQGKTAVNSATATRDELMDSANSALSSAHSSGESAFATVNSALSAATDKAKADSFSTWSDSELKRYLDSYGVNTYQGSNRNKLLAEVRRQTYLFNNGGKEPSYFEKASGLLGTIKAQAYKALGWSNVKAEEAKEKVKQEL